MILFLDYDGVLHPDPCLNSRRLFENVPRLNASLEEFPEVCLVLSTSWRTMQGLKELMSPLPEGLQSRVLGTTPIFSSFTAPPHLMPYKRHAECVQWMVDNDQSDRDWFAVDDRPIVVCAVLRLPDRLRLAAGVRRRGGGAVEVCVVEGEAEDVAAD